MKKNSNHPNYELDFILNECKNILNLNSLSENQIRDIIICIATISKIKIPLHIHIDYLNLLNTCLLKSSLSNIEKELIIDIYVEVFFTYSQKKEREIIIQPILIQLKVVCLNIELDLNQIEKIIFIVQEIIKINNTLHQSSLCFIILKVQENLKLFKKSINYERIEIKLKTCKLKLLSGIDDNIQSKSLKSLLLNN